jgi:hypothetical protein
LKPEIQGLDKIADVRANDQLLRQRLNFQNRIAKSSDPPSDLFGFQLIARDDGNHCRTKAFLFSVPIHLVGITDHFLYGQQQLQQVGRAQLAAQSQFIDRVGSMRDGVRPTFAGHETTPVFFLLKKINHILFHDPDFPRGKIGNIAMNGQQQGQQQDRESAGENSVPFFFAHVIKHVLIIHHPLQYAVQVPGRK